MSRTFVVVEINLPKDKINLPKDKINLPKDKINLPKDKINLPKDKINLPKDKINLPKDKINLPVVIRYLHWPHIEVYGESVILAASPFICQSVCQLAMLLCMFTEGYCKLYGWCQCK